MVDEIRVWPHAKAPFLKGSCHLTTSGELVELHAFAKLLGVRREWFQAHSEPHYDLTPKRRAAALAVGAIFVPARDQARERLTRSRARGPGKRKPKANAR